ncbi:MAG TPA: bifunctional hydroxymethylpyrimidine kinase/phosphomethylpyrimidine kinase [Candidatus Binataceae bacterium]|nr:bifunctional hydroxymethylpyrimidine kinase/phosphomethylpyrimidine kinase [Candidatus Binataceae bacterium]
MRASRSYRAVGLTIAGSDPGGGAGIQADLKTFAALGVYGFSAITSVIAQNSSKVLHVSAVTPSMVAAQIEAVALECKPDAIKIGALANAAIVRAVAQALLKHKLAAPAIDPVLTSTSGTRLLSKSGERALIADLLPLARVITPNIPEAQMLTGVKINSAKDAEEAARRLVKLGARAVVIKGGHLAGDTDAVDLLYDGRSFVSIKAQRIAVDAHGTGCAFAAAIAAYLARGRDLDAAVRGAKEFVTRALRESFQFGRGRPLLDHFAGARAVKTR